MLCRNNMWKWPVNGYTILHTSEFCGLILREKGAWSSPHLGKSFPSHIGQRQTSLVPEGLFSKSFFRSWKTVLKSKNQPLRPAIESSIGKGWELKRNFVSSSHQYSHIFDPTCGSSPSQKTFPSCDFLAHIVKLLRSKRKNREESLSSPDLQRNSLNQQSTNCWVMALCKQYLG